MKRLSGRLFFALTSCLMVLIVLMAQLSGDSRTLAQGGIAADAQRPFRLPFAEPTGPDTWLMGQPYGNTTGAYRQRFTTYGASGGIHFGIDLSAPCGTEIVAIADGVVFTVDGPFGAPPHNLMIDHPDLGYASLYGHLLEAPDLQPSQVVKQGQVVALVGDSAELCYRRAHLHLEIRDLNHIRKYNPTTLIEANWDNLAMVGDSGRDFARNLDEPRLWQTLYDQPEARTGGPILNDFANPWPLDWSKQEVGSAGSSSAIPFASEPVPAPVPAALAALPVGKQITAGDCCTNPYWANGSSEVRFIDRPASDTRLGVWGVELTQTDPVSSLVTERLGVYSPDGKWVAYPDRGKGVAVIERLADGWKWELDTDENGLSFSPNSQQVMWTASNEDEPRDTRQETIWLADVEGGPGQAVFSDRRVSRLGWLSDNDLLMTRRFGGTSDVQLFILSLDDGRQTNLRTGPQMRGTSFSPDRRHLVYYVTFEDDASKNGVWLLDLQNPGGLPQKLPFFGSYRWRDSERLIFIPLEPDAETHQFYEYNIQSKETTPLFQSEVGLTIANNDWQVSPDGQKIALVAAKGADLDGIWILEIDQEEDGALSFPERLYKFFSEKFLNAPQ